jgi:hypothetical protein
MLKCDLTFSSNPQKKSSSNVASSSKSSKTRATGCEAPGDGRTTKNKANKRKKAQKRKR